MSTQVSVEETLLSAPKEPTLRRDFVWTFAGNGIYAASQWAVVALLAKTGTPDVVGRYAFAVAVATPVITFANLQLRSVQTSDLRKQFQFQDYLRFRLFTIPVALTALAALCVVMRYEWQTALLVAAVGVSLATEAVSDVYYGVMQIHLKMDRIATSMILRALLSLVGLSAAMYITRSLIYGVLGIAMARIAVLLAYDLRAGIRGFPIDALGSATALRDALPLPSRIGKTEWRIFRTAFPVGVVAVLVSLNTYIPRYFIEWSAGARELGIFSALSFFQSSGNMVSGALGQAAFVRLARAYKRQSAEHFISLLSRLLLIGIVLGAAGIAVTMFAGEQILEILYRPEYAQRADLLVYLMIAAGFGYLAQFVGYAVTAARMFRPQLPLSILVAITLLLACYLLVPAHGVMGAVWAIVVTMVAQLIGYGFLLFIGIRRHGRSVAD